MPSSRQLHLAAFMRPASIHTGAWRYPGAWPDMNFNFAHIKRCIQTLERARFDAFFMADHMAVLNMPIDALKRSHTATSFEPFTLLSALSQATERIGLVATGSTTFDAPYHIARRFASLDHISGGRAGWNIVTTANPDAALNFGLDEHMEHGERYLRAREFYDVVTGLWDSWADDAFVRNVEEGIFFDPAKMHVLNHKGKYLSVRGPLNIARPIQGWPVIVQAGASDAGRKLAAATAEAVFTAQSDIVAGRQFYSDMKGRMEKLGRSREHMKILPGCLVVVGDTVGEARAKRAKLDSLVNDANAIASLSIALGHDAAKFDPDAPLPENIPESNASKTGREHAIALGKRENLTVRQLAQRLGGYSGLAMVGTPASIADEMEEWLETKASDGFTVMFPYLPGGLDDFCVRVIPELQRRGLFRRDYEGVTLRENLGLPQPQNRFLSNCPTTRPRGHTSSLLAGIDAFRDMDHSARDRLEHASTVLQPRDGSEIFSQGDPADAVYAIVAGEGHVRFGAADQGSKTSMVAVCKQGDIFGEIGVIDGGARTATAIVEGRVRLARIPASSFLAALSSSAGLGHVVSQMLARRLRWIVTLFQDPSFERCDQAALRGLLRSFG